jgi:hypothetical protein
MKLTAEEENVIGDFLISLGRRYSDTKDMLGNLRRFLTGRGAPHKRNQTLQMMDARIANRWSYRQLAIHLCDCGQTTHTEHCKQRIWHRLKELQQVLEKYSIILLPTQNV